MSRDIIINGEVIPAAHITALGVLYQETGKGLFTFYTLIHGDQRWVTLSYNPGEDMQAQKAISALYESIRTLLKERPTAVPLGKLLIDSAAVDRVLPRPDFSNGWLLRIHFRRGYPLPSLDIPYGDNHAGLMADIEAYTLRLSQMPDLIPLETEQPA